jgi:nitrogen fixation protein FixH
MTAGMKWLLAIAGLLSANVIAMVVLTVVANNGTTQVIPAYYDKAVHYNDELDRSATSRALGWHADVAIAGGAIDVVVADASGAAIDGAHVRVTGYQRAHAGEPVDVVLAATGGGHYHGQAARRGWHDLTVIAERDGEQYTQNVAVEAR